MARKHLTNIGFSAIFGGVDLKPVAVSRTFFRGGPAHVRRTDDFLATDGLPALDYVNAPSCAAQSHQPRGEPIDPDASWSYFYYTFGMERDQAIARLKEYVAELRQLGIEHLYLFKSTARGEAREDSGVDLFVDHPLGSIGLYELMEMQETALCILGRKADIMTRRGLHRVFRGRIEASALQVF